MLIRRLKQNSVDFDVQLNQLLNREDDQRRVTNVVSDIVADVRQRGDQAVLEYTQRFDQRALNSIADITLNKDSLQKKLREYELSSQWKQPIFALKQAAERIQEYHQRQSLTAWNYIDSYGNELGQRITPLDRAALYVPGGKASYPSSVLMNSIPARVAGVPHLTMTVPAPQGELNPLVLAAAAICEIDIVYTMGGAQAVAALAYGTESIQAVDKIVGPGNQYVAEAKRQVFGQVGIDMIAGPSEILVVCDGQTPVEWIVWDLLSQAEHDEAAQSILLCPDIAFIDAVEKEIERVLHTSTRADIIRKSLANFGALIETNSLESAMEVINKIAPEHLELSVDEPEKFLPNIRHAGAIFLGRHTPEAFGDYCAGPNHVLPTSGTARFASPLGVPDFQKRTSLIRCSVEGAKHLASIAFPLAEVEGLEAHAKSAQCRN